MPEISLAVCKNIVSISVICKSIIYDRGKKISNTTQERDWPIIFRLLYVTFIFVYWEDISF